MDLGRPSRAAPLLCGGRDAGGSGVGVTGLDDQAVAFGLLEVAAALGRDGVVAVRATDFRIQMRARVRDAMTMGRGPRHRPERDQVHAADAPQ